MHSFTGSVSSRSHLRCSGLLARAIRLLRREVVERPSIHWAQTRPLDFEGEDTSLTQAHLELLR